MKLLSLFSGIGAFEKALNNIGVDYELVGFSEIDKWAIQSYCTIHDVSEDLNLGDVSKIKGSDFSDEIDIITHGSPCQDFSVAGKRLGGDKGSNTRSSLMWETVRIIGEVSPKYVIWENVRSVLFKNNIHNFELYLNSLNKLGYNNYYETLNAKNFGIPQNRNRVFVVSIRKDIDDNSFKFPKGKKDSRISMSSILQEASTIDEKYYYKDRVFLKTNDLLAKPTSKLHHVAYFKYPNSNKRHQSNTFYDSNGLSPTVDTAGGGNTEPKIYIDEQYRKLTPLECWRLMDFDDKDYKKVKKLGLSDSQLYKQAGNSIVVSVLEAIFTNLLLKESL